jgi:hypothetical protein
VIRSPEALANFAGTVVICSALFAKEIEAQVKQINPTIKTVVIR